MSNDTIKKAEKVIDLFFATLTESQPLYDPEREKLIGDVMMESLAKELADKEAERKKQWGNRYPYRLNEKPPPGYVRSNRVYPVVVSGEGEGVNRGKSGRKEKVKGK